MHQSNQRAHVTRALSAVMFCWPIVLQRWEQDSQSSGSIASQAITSPSEANSTNNNNFACFVLLVDMVVSLPA